MKRKIKIVIWSVLAVLTSSLYTRAAVGMAVEPGAADTAVEAGNALDVNGAVALVICAAIVLCGVVIIIVTGRSKRK